MSTELHSHYSSVDCAIHKTQTATTSKVPPAPAVTTFELEQCVQGKAHTNVRKQVVL